MDPRLNAAATVARLVPTFSMAWPVLSMTLAGVSKHDLRMRTAFTAKISVTTIQTVAFGQFMPGCAGAGGCSEGGVACSVFSAITSLYRMGPVSESPMGSVSIPIGPAGHCDRQTALEVLELHTLNKRSR